jgi:hypothetical protein
MPPLIMAALTKIRSLPLKKFGMVTAMWYVTIQAFFCNREMLP